MLKEYLVLASLCSLSQNFSGWHGYDGMSRYRLWDQLLQSYQEILRDRVGGLKRLHPRDQELQRLHDLRTPQIHLDEGKACNVWLDLTACRREKKGKEVPQYPLSRWTRSNKEIKWRNYEISWRRKEKTCKCIWKHNQQSCRVIIDYVVDKFSICMLT